MRIKEHRRLSLYGTVAFLLVAVIGGALLAVGSTLPGVLLLSVGLAGAIIASTAIRLYGKMTADAFFRGKDRKDE